MVYMSSSIRADYNIKKIVLLKLGLGLVNLMLKLNQLTSFINYLANQHLVTLLVSSWTKNCPCKIKRGTYDP